MRKMTEPEMRALVASCNWATICTVSPEQKPYAIEATPFPLDNYVAFMINPRGTTCANIQANTNVLLKYNITEPDLAKWAAVSCYGKAKLIADRELLNRGIEQLAQLISPEMAAMAKKFCDRPKPAPLLLVTVTEMTGRCNVPKEALLPFPERIVVRG